MIKDLKQPGPTAWTTAQLAGRSAHARVAACCSARRDADPDVGPELYRTDGTRVRHRPGEGHQAGRRRLAARAPPFARLGTASGTSPRTTAPTGDELWRTNGTKTGTRMVKDIAPDARNDLSTYIWGTFRGDVVVQASDGNERRRPRRRSCGGATAPPPAPSA